MANVNFSASTNGKPEPGKTMGILSLVGAFLLPPAGLVCGIIGLKQSKEAKKDNPLALAGTIISGVAILISIIVMIIAFSVWGSTANKVMQLGEGLIEETQQDIRQARDAMQENQQQQAQQGADQRQQILDQAQQAIDEANQQIQSTPDTTQQMQDAQAAAQQLLQQMQQ